MRLCGFWLFVNLLTLFVVCLFNLLGFEEEHRDCLYAFLKSIIDYRRVLKRGIVEAWHKGNLGDKEINAD